MVRWMPCCICGPFEDPGCTRDFSCIVYILQAMSSAKLKSGRFLLAAQFNNALDRCYLESWIGFERSLGLVLPNTQVAAIFGEAGEQEQKVAMKDWMQKLGRELQTPGVQSVLYQEGKRYVCRIQPTTILPGSSPLKPGATYLITGGAGKLGLLFAEHLAKTQSANLVLTGRSPLDEEKRSKIKAIEDLGSQVLYIQADVCSRADMKEGLRKTKERFGGIDGVIHAAGVRGNQIIFGKKNQRVSKDCGCKNQRNLNTG